ncbi:MAG TPA: peptidoglycan DD-metalloendopeptidase family protein [Spirochaetota bacterium]|nr:peptidoglycan DD-metalloendopeptidase family protein [Spirochaetota bacterium]
MKRTFPFLCAFLALSIQSVSAQDFYDSQRKGNRDMVKRQYAADLEKKEAILRKMREFIGEINGRLKQGSSTKIDVPIDIESVSDIKTTDLIHTSKKVPPREYAYLLDDVAYHEEGKSGSAALGRCAFGEKVELLLQSEEMETVDRVRGPWLLARRAGGEEGWVFSGYLSKDRPGKRIKKETAPPPVVEAPVEKKSAGAFYAYVAAADVLMRASGSSSGSVTGRFDFAERLEVLEQSNQTETIGGKTRPWFRVGRLDGSEGWIFGGFLQKKVPERPAAGDAATGEDAPALTTGSREFAVPTTGKVSSRFGHRVHPVTKKSQSFHSGIDIFAPRGTRVNATADGVVKTASYKNNGYGNLIILEHEKELSSYYAHLEEILVSPGQLVRKGDLIGTVDSTGMSTGNHLHFEVRRGGKAMDPDEFLR